MVSPARLGRFLSTTPGSSRGRPPSGARAPHPAGAEGRLAALLARDDGDGVARHPRRGEGGPPVGGVRAALPRTRDPGNRVRGDGAARGGGGRTPRGIRPARADRLRFPPRGPPASPTHP